MRGIRRFPGRFACVGVGMQRRFLFTSKGSVLLQKSDGSGPSMDTPTLDPQPQKAPERSRNLGPDFLEPTPERGDQLPSPRMDASPMAPATVEYDETVPYTEEDRLIELVEQKQRDKILSSNAALPDPVHPSKLIPRYERVKKHARLYRFDEEHPMITRKEHYVPLPPPKQHPWVKGQPIGPHIVHGDGQQRIVGHGEVGFEESSHCRDWPKHWRGFQRFTSVGLRPSDHHGEMNEKTVIKHSLQLSGKGIFATKDIEKGDTIMIVKSQTVNLGYNSEIDRLCEMVTDLLLKAYHGAPEDREYLHQWILTGQMSNMVERWPQDATNKVLEDIGGEGILDELELHPMHVGRLASIIDMNSFLVESYYAERKGMGYWPEPGLFNHSCCPNCDYDIIPQQMFGASEYCPKGEDSFGDPYDEDLPLELQKQTAAPARPKQVMTLETEEDKAIAELQADLVEKPTYLFCCKANRDLKAGEELLISYVPPDWRYEDRQYVLHDRYRFWCKCPKCAISVDTNLRFIPRVMIAIAIFYAFLQLFLYRAREETYGRWDDAVEAAKAGEYQPIDEKRYFS